MMGTLHGCRTVNFYPYLSMDIVGFYFKLRTQWLQQGITYSIIPKNSFRQLEQIVNKELFLQK